MKTILYIVVAILAACPTLSAQPAGLEVGQVLIVNYPTVKDGSDKAFRSLFAEVTTSWAKGQPGVGVAHFVADRGKDNGGHMLVCSIRSIADRTKFPAGTPFSGSKSFAVITNPSSYTEYHLIGADQVASLPVAGILGMHYINVKPTRKAEFEKFVVDKLHPSVSRLFPDMQMLYYKAVAGENMGTYLTIWTIRSTAARDKYWPAGKPETDLLKNGYKDVTLLGKELEYYLVEGSYLESGKGAAAIFESKEWTDYVIR